MHPSIEQRFYEIFRGVHEWTPFQSSDDPLTAPVKVPLFSICSLRLLTCIGEELPLLTKQADIRVFFERVLDQLLVTSEVHKNLESLTRKELKFFDQCVPRLSRTVRPSHQHHAWNSTTIMQVQQCTGGQQGGQRGAPRDKKSPEPSPERLVPHAAQRVSVASSKIQRCSFSLSLSPSCACSSSCACISSCTC